MAQSLLAQSLLGIGLSTIWQILISTYEDIALYYGGSVLAGTAIGAAAGVFVGGVGAIPGAAVGAAVGAETGAWLLALLGLKSLIEGLGTAIPEALRCYQDGFLEAWGPTHRDTRGPSMPPSSGNTFMAAGTIARGHVILIGAMLAALVAYLTRGRGGNKAAALEEIRSSARLGPKVADWLTANEDKLVNHSQLRPGQRWAAMREEPVAQSPRAQASAPANPDIKRVEQGRLQPGTPEHKADRWQRYQQRSGKKDYAQWSRQYDTNMRNYQYGLSREADYREATGASQGRLKTPLTYRQIDILKADDMYAGQIKTGPVSLTKENALAIQKDAELVKRNWQVEHILEQGASKPYLDALERAGIDYRLGPQIPRPGASQ